MPIASSKIREHTRREFLQTTSLFTAGIPLHSSLLRAEEPVNPLSLKLGLTTSSIQNHLASDSAPGKVKLLDLPRFLREELELEIIDLNTSTIVPLSPAQQTEFRKQAERAGCTITNLKMNQKGLDFASPDRDLREKSIAVYEKSIEDAQRLGCRWARPLPLARTPDLDLYRDSYHRLIDFARPKGIRLLVENYGWMQNDPDAIPKIRKLIGDDLDVSPDTGNWTDTARAEGLRKAFPFAVTCDFKAKALGPKPGREHKSYDLKECFQIGWDTGFRGPWCFEHAHPKLEDFVGETIWLRDQLRTWIAKASKS